MFLFYGGWHSFLHFNLISFLFVAVFFQWTLKFETFASREATGETKKELIWFSIRNWMREEWSSTNYSARWKWWSWFQSIEIELKRSKRWRPIVDWTNWITCSHAKTLISLSFALCLLLILSHRMPKNRCQRSPSMPTQNRFWTSNEIHFSRWIKIQSQVFSTLFFSFGDWLFSSLPLSSL